MGQRVLNERRILVVEDEYMIAKDVGRDLENAGAIVVGPVPSVAMALNLIAQETELHAGVLDVNLNGEQSYAVAEALEARGIPYLFATGYSSADLPAEWRRARIEMKPLRIDAVAELLQ